MRIPLDGAASFAWTRGSMIRKVPLAERDVFIRLRRQALEVEPLAFSSSPADDHAQSVEIVRQYLAHPTQAIFGAFEPDLVGVAGIAQQAGENCRHKARLWGVYVTPSRRGEGLGCALVQAAIAFARSLEGISQVQLAVADSARAARALYEQLGFVTWGTEPAALRVGDTSVAEHHMTLLLTSSGT
jgi:ribosomal protein S18 acetylase RimI-like enzyme